ncbi:YceI family protein [Lysobacter xanthus]
MFKRIALAAALAAVSTVAFAAPVSYAIDANHTSVTASWSHFGLSHPVATFNQVEGTIVYDAQNVGASSVKVTLPLAGLESGVAAFDEHLRGEGFFDAAKYPSVTFASTKVEAVGGKKLRVTGDLTIKGVTKPAVLDVTLNGAGPHPMSKREAIGFDATAVVKRSDFGVDKYAPNVSDEVQIRITTEASVPKAEGERAKAVVPPKKK